MGGGATLPFQSLYATSLGASLGFRTRYGLAAAGVLCGAQHGRFAVSRSGRADDD